MQITLNNGPLDIDGIDENVSVLELVDLVEGSLQGTGSTIVRIFLDGKEFSAENREKLQQEKLMAYEKAQLVAATAADLIVEAFSDSTEILLHLEDITMEAASELRVGQIRPALTKFLEILNGLDWFVTIIKNADIAFAAKMAETAYENERQGLIARVCEQISAAEAAQKAEDWVGVADIAEYEFCEIFKAARKFIASLMKE